MNKSIYTTQYKKFLDLVKQRSTLCNTKYNISLRSYIHSYNIKIQEQVLFKSFTLSGRLSNQRQTGSIIFSNMYSSSSKYEQNKKIQSNGKKQLPKSVTQVNDHLKVKIAIEFLINEGRFSLL
jgi:lysyl-tRNA synthetase class II